jgi:hypothetical protein
MYIVIVSSAIQGGKSMFYIMMFYIMMFYIMMFYIMHNNLGR